MQEVQAMRYSGIVTCLLIVMMMPAISAEDQQITAGIFADAISAKSLVHDDVQVRGGIMFDLDKQFMLTIPVTYTIQKYGYSLLDASVNLRWTPTKYGLFAGISFFQSVSIQGDQRPEDWFHHMSEIQVGWHVRIGSLFYIEPMLLFRDPAGIHKESLEFIQASVEDYSRFTAVLNVGISGVRIGRNERE
jgi:hypothetical protein